MAFFYLSLFACRCAADCGRSKGAAILKPPSCSRASVVVRGLEDPHAVLGVEPGCDEKQVKKAYKKLALKLHPDVSKDELAEAKFKGLREAYELLMGKGDPDRQSRAPFGGNWEFHDWYWSFSMRQRQRRQNPDTASQHSSAAARKHKPQVLHQLDGLKARAAKRAARSSRHQPFVQGDSCDQCAAPGVKIEAPAAATHFSPGSPVIVQENEAHNPDHVPYNGDGTLTDTYNSWRDLLTTVETQMSRHAALEAALSRHHVAVAHCRDHIEALQLWAQSRWGLRGNAAGHVGGERHTGPSSQASVPFEHLGETLYTQHPNMRTASTWSAVGQQHDSTDAATAEFVRAPCTVMDEAAAEGASETHRGPHSQRDGSAQRSQFRSSSEGRSAISSQLAGLRRAQALKAEAKERT